MADQFLSVTFRRDIDVGIFRFTAGTTTSLPDAVARGFGDDVVINGPGTPARHNSAAEQAAGQALVTGYGNPLSRLRAAMANPCDLTVMASPPTITQSAAGASSTLTNPTAIPDAALVQWPSTGGQVKQNPNFIDNAAEGMPFSGSRCLASYFFATDATAFEIHYRPDGVNSDFRLWVDGQLASSVITAPAFDGSFYRQKIDFGGSRKLRQIEIEGMKVPPANFYIGGNDSYEAPSLPRCTCTVIGDSFTEGTGATSFVNGYGGIMTKLLGLRKVLLSGLGGTGYSATTGGTRKRLRYRFVTDIVPFAADVIVWNMGVNDAGVSLSQLAADTNAAFDLGQQYFPDSVHIVFPGFNPRNSQATTLRDTIQTCAAGRTNFYFIDSFALNEITGTGKVGSTTGTGNSDWIVDSGGTHPVDAGHEYLGRWRANAIRSLLGG